MCDYFAIFIKDNSIFLSIYKHKTSQMKKKQIRKGTKVICALWNKSEEAKVNYLNPNTGMVGLRYKGSKAEYTASINDCVRV